MWLSIGKWVVTAIIMPIIHRLIDSWLKSREKAKELKAKFKKNEAKTEVYEKDPSDSNFSDLP